MAGGTPVPAVALSRLVVSGLYRYVRNLIYVGFLVILFGQTLLTESPGMLTYTAIACLIGGAAVRFYDEPVLSRRFGAEYQAYRQGVRAWIPRIRPWTPGVHGTADDRHIAGALVS